MRIALQTRSITREYQDNYTGSLGQADRRSTTRPARSDDWVAALPCSPESRRSLSMRFRGSAHRRMRSKCSSASRCGLCKHMIAGEPATQLRAGFVEGGRRSVKPLDARGAICMIIVGVFGGLTR